MQICRNFYSSVQSCRVRGGLDIASFGKRPFRVLKAHSFLIKKGIWIELGPKGYKIDKTVIPIHVGKYKKIQNWIKNIYMYRKKCIYIQLSPDLFLYYTYSWTPLIRAQYIVFIPNVIIFQLLILLWKLNETNELNKLLTRHLNGLFQIRDN